MIKNVFFGPTDKASIWEWLIFKKMFLIWVLSAQNPPKKQINAEIGGLDSFFAHLRPLFKRVLYLKNTLLQLISAASN